MVLKSDCIRDVLIAVEKLQRYTTNDSGNVAKNDLMIEALYNDLPTYSKEDIYYTLFTLDQAGFVNISVKWAGDCLWYCAINYLTYSGHEFLERIRDEKRWGKVKGILNTVRDYSLSAISAIAEGVTSAAITSYLSQ